MEQEGYWNLKDLLDNLMGTRAEVRPAPRAEIWASDLGKPYIDRWLQMKGTPYSNPPTGQSLVTFFLGKQIELGIAEMLTRCGVAFRTQERLTVHLEGCLPIVGRPDLVVEVQDWSTVIEALKQRMMEDPIDHGDAEEREGLWPLIAAWQERCPQGLGPTVCEVKSLNSWAFKYHRGREGLGNAYPHHRLQLYTYLKALHMNEGHLVYVARDTGWIEELIIRPTDDLEQAWREDIATMSDYYLRDERPPLEPRTVEGKENWRVAYSRYRDYLYQEVPHGAFAL